MSLSCDEENVKPVSKICLICAHHFAHNYNKEDNEEEKGLFSSLRALDIISVEELEDLFRQLKKDVGEGGGAWGVSFCPTHVQDVKILTGIQQEIQTLLAQVESVKSKLVKEITTFANVAEENVAFNSIRKCIHVHLQKKSGKTAKSLVKECSVRIERLQELETRVLNYSLKKTSTFRPRSSRGRRKIKPILRNLDCTVRKKAKKPEKQTIKKEEATTIPELLHENIKIEVDEEEIWSPVPSPCSSNEYWDGSTQNFPPQEEKDNLENPTGEWFNALKDDNSSNFEEDFEKILEKKQKRRRKATGSRKQKTPKKSGNEEKVKRNFFKKNNSKMCFECSKEFPTISKLEDHMIENHGPRPFVCHCGRTFKRAYLLEYHKIRAHGNGNQFRCQFCQKNFNLKCDLKTHVRNVHPQDSSLKSCPTCQKQYPGEYRLKQHILHAHIHKGIPKKQTDKVACEHCGKLFVKLYDMKAHQARVHFLTHVKPVCKDCGKVLSDERSLYKHRRSQHSKDFRFMCQICGSLSLFKSHYIQHMTKKHPGVDFDASPIKNPESKETDGLENQNIQKPIIQEYQDQQSELQLEVQDPEDPSYIAS